MSDLHLLASSRAALYEVTAGTSPVTRYVFTSPESRAICNDPFVVGVDYTDKLEHACSECLTLLKHSSKLKLEEDRTAVLHILRGGLNFGLRTALHRAFGWNKHASAFVSAQRARSAKNPDDWYICENDYQKMHYPDGAAIVFGDVVATGTSLSYALKQLLDFAEREKSSIGHLLFFTIGGSRSEELLAEIDATCRTRFEGFGGSSVVYLEGRFAVAKSDTPISIKLTGTDLLRRDSILAPQFLDSQYDNPLYPLERCTIYDAGSRAFWLPEYFEDVVDYWQQTLELAKGGMTFDSLLRERFPALEAGRFGEIDLTSLAQSQLERAQNWSSDKPS